MNRRAGFSLVELMTVLAIAAILLALGVPGLRGMLQAHRVSAAANDFMMALNLTRSEAIERGRRVDLVPAGDGADWTAGWVVFVDRDGDRKPGPGEPVIFRHPALATGVLVGARLTDAARPYLAYTASGRTRTDAHEQVAQSGSWHFSAGPHARRIVLNFLGRARLCDPARDPRNCQ